MADRFNAPSACRVSRDGACDERVQNCPHLRMRPHPAAGRADIALVELGRNGIVARFPDSTDGIATLPKRGINPLHDDLVDLQHTRVAGLIEDGSRLADSPASPQR
jgi:hypothetical protein